MLRNIERIVLDECLQLTPDVAEEIERRIGHRAANGDFGVASRYGFE